MSVSTPNYSFIITANHVAEKKNIENIYIDLGLKLPIEKIRIEDISLIYSEVVPKI